MKQFEFFGPVTFCYALFYTFCMFRNGSGISFPFFIAASLLYLCFALSKLGLTLKKGSGFYMVCMMLLAVSTFCTDDARIIVFNKCGIFLLGMCFLLKQFYDTTRWDFGKYLTAIFQMMFLGLAEFCQPFADAKEYFSRQKGNSKGNVWYGFLGAVIALPVLVIVIFLLSGADAVFRKLINQLLEGIRFDNLFNICFRIGFLFMASYMLLSFLCKKKIPEEVRDKRTGEPMIAITMDVLLTIVYLIFSVIQIVYLFLGKMQLPEGYTYAAYAREGFFQLLAVSILNLILVLIGLGRFRESRILKGILTLMSMCTFVMIASSAMRMLIYIHYYNLTFLRILVLWGLAVLFVVFVGIMIQIFQKQFPLFRYSMVVVTVLYLVLSFSHPDLWIAYVNVEATKGSPEGVSCDYNYLAGLSADAAPVMIPYLKEMGFQMEDFYDRDSLSGKNFWDYAGKGDFGYYYLGNIKDSTENFGIRTYNVSRHMALRQIQKATADSPLSGR